MLSQTTHTFANHEVPLECDVYEADDYPQSKPVFLFFHSGGLVGGARVCIPPWLAQVCYQRKWSLISASYRLLPQAGGKGLLEDALAAYEFARAWKSDGSEAKREVIVGGASAGFFVANLVAHHAKPAPVAMLCITGIPTFRHAFFNSSTLLTPEPLTDEQMAKFINGPVVVGTTQEHDGTAFSVHRLLPSGLKDPDYTHPSRPAELPRSDNPERGWLYDYYLYNNGFLDLVGDVDPGFAWAKDDPLGEKHQSWPPTIFIQGDADVDVSMDVTTSTVDSLSPKKRRLCIAKGQGHLFERTSYLEDDSPGMEAVHQAVTFLDEHF